MKSKKGSVTIAFLVILAGIATLNAINDDLVKPLPADNEFVASPKGMQPVKITMGRDLSDKQAKELNDLDPYAFDNEK